MSSGSDHLHAMPLRWLGALTPRARGVPGRVRALPLWFVLLMVGAAVRAPVFGNPVVHVDEEFYFTVARAMLDGALPYVDIWDRKPIGLFLLYVPAAALGYPTGIWAYQAMALACAVATAGMIARIAARAGWERGAPFAAIAYLLWLNLLEGQGGQAPVFYNLPMVLAAACIAPTRGGNPDADTRFRRGVVAMLFVGLSLQVKYSVVFEGLFFGLTLLWREWRVERDPRRLCLRGCVWAGVAMAPTALAWAGYVLAGHGNAFVFANFTSILARKPDPVEEQLANLGSILVLAGPLALLALVGLRRGLRVAQTHAVAGWTMAWLGVAALGLLAVCPYFDHYALPMLVPAAIGTAAFFQRSGAGRGAGVVLLALALVAGQVLLHVKAQLRGTAAQFAEVTRVIGQGPGCLYVFSGSPMLYPATGRCAATIFRFPSHIGRVREDGALPVRQGAELDRILATKPAVVVLRDPYNGEREDLRARVEARMRAEHYRLDLVPLGGQTIEVWKRPDAQ